MKIRNALGLGLAAGLLGLVCGLSNSSQTQKPDSNKPITSVKFYNPWTNEPFQLNDQGQNIHEIERLKIFAKYTSGFEGRSNKVYDPNPRDEKSEPTIGIGHYMDRGDSRETFSRVLPLVSWENIYHGKNALTDEQVNKLFAEDLKTYVGRAKKLIPEFDGLPEYVGAALVDMTYRGDLGDSPKTLALINSGKFAKAAEEYINRKEYREAESKGMRGVKRRMDSNRQRLLDYANSLKDK